MVNVCFFLHFRGVLTGKYKRGEKLDPVSGRIAHIAKDETKAMQSAPAWSKYANNESYWNLLDVMEQVGKRFGKKYFTCLVCFKIFLNIIHVKKKFHGQTTKGPKQYSRNLLRSPSDSNKTRYQC
jgi:hypothetical protein